MAINDKDSISIDTRGILVDYANKLYTSTVCVHELIHLFQIGKIAPKTGNVLTDIEQFAKWLDMMSINVVPVTVRHLEEYAALPMLGDHRDPNDRLIIAQSISDRIPLISSDRKFAQYAKYGLDFIFNER
jgi:PIN domain nuclease of toxin-antitoxin system